MAKVVRRRWLLVRDDYDLIFNTENKIAYSRQLYNSTVANYNMSLQSFPVNLIAGMFHFTQREYLKADEEAAKQVPEVNF